MPLNLTAHFSKQSRQTVPHINRTIFKAVNYDLTSPRSTAFFSPICVITRKETEQIWITISYYCELPTWEMRMQWLEILPGSTLVTERQADAE